VFDFLPPDLAKSRRAFVQKVITTGKPQRFEGHGLAGRIMANHIFPVWGAAGKVTGVAVYAQDITKRTQAEQALRKAHDSLEQKVKDRTARLRALAIQLVRAEERERQRIAYILHEDLQQMMAGARLMLNELRKCHPREGAKLLTDKISHVLEEATQVTRTLALDLRPPALYEAGLVAGLKWLAGDTKKKFGLAVQVRIDEAVEPKSNELRVFIYEAVRELLLNLVKHAGVKRAQVTVTATKGNHIQVEVQDRGKGFDPGKNKANGFGLFSLRERAESFGGDLNIRSSVGKGTCVTVKVPNKQ